MVRACPEDAPSLKAAQALEQYGLMEGVPAQRVWTRWSLWTQNILWFCDELVCDFHLAQSNITQISFCHTSVRPEFPFGVRSSAFQGIHFTCDLPETLYFCLHFSPIVLNSIPLPNCFLMFTLVVSMTAINMLSIFSSKPFMELWVVPDLRQNPK